MKNYLLIPAALMLLASCSNDTDIKTESSTTKEAPVPIRLGTQMSVTTRSNSQTLQATELAPGQTVGVYIYYKDATTTNTTYNYGYKNLAYTVVDHTTVMGASAGDLALVTATDQPYFPENKSQNVDIYAFSPRTGVYTTDGELTGLTSQDVFSTQANQTTEDNYKASDFVWGKAANVANGTATAIEIPLKHKLSKVNINIAPGTGMTLDKLDKAKITLNGVVLDGTVNFTTGEVTTRTGSSASSVVLSNQVDKNVTTTFNTTTPAATHTACTSSAVIIPQDIAASTSFITIQLWDATANSGAGDYTSTYNVTTTATTTFAAETVYTYNILVNTQGLTLTTSISDWTTGAITPGVAE